MPDAQLTSDLREWDDEQIIAAADFRLPESESGHISELLNLQQAGKITAEEQAELQKLINRYQALQLHQALALGEAIRRGLRSVPVSPDI